MIRHSIAFVAAALAASTALAAEPAKPRSVIRLDHSQSPVSHSDLHRFTCDGAGTSTVELQIDTSHRGDGQDRWRVSSLRVDKQPIPAAELAKVDAAIGSRALDLVFPLCDPGGGATIRVRMWTHPAPGDEGDGRFEWLLLTLDNAGALSFLVTD